MMEDDFYATIKFKSGEEIFARVGYSEEEDRTFLILMPVEKVPYEATIIALFSFSVISLTNSLDSASTPP